jgi:hypothetical protein
MLRRRSSREDHSQCRMPEKRGCFEPPVFRVYAIERELNATSLPAIISLAPAPAELACESSGLPDLELLSEGQGVRS